MLASLINLFCVSQSLTQFDCLICSMSSYYTSYQPSQYAFQPQQQGQLNIQQQQPQQQQVSEKGLKLPDLNINIDEVEGKIESGIEQLWNWLLCSNIIWYVVAGVLLWWLLSAPAVKPVSTGCTCPNPGDILVVFVGQFALSDPDILSPIVTGALCADKNDMELTNSNLPDGGPCSTIGIDYGTNYINYAQCVPTLPSEIVAYAQKYTGVLTYFSVFDNVYTPLGTTDQPSNSNLNWWYQSNNGITTYICLNAISS